MYGVNVIFSMFQSAAMGGYGAAVLGWGIRASTVAGPAVELVQGLWRNWAQPAGSEKR